MVLPVKNPPANVGGARDAGSIPESGRFYGVGNDTSSILAWKIPWTGGLQSVGPQRVGHN